jgi:phosphoglycerol transferase MdoB-like AlkP superfamily enzyme
MHNFISEQALKKHNIKRRFFIKMIILSAPIILFRIFSNVFRAMGSPDFAPDLEWYYALLIALSLYSLIYLYAGLLYFLHIKNLKTIKIIMICLLFIIAISFTINDWLWVEVQLFLYENDINRERTFEILVQYVILECPYNENTKYLHELLLKYSKDNLNSSGDPFIRDMAREAIRGVEFKIKNPGKFR